MILVAKLDIYYEIYFHEIKKYFVLIIQFIKPFQSNFDINVIYISNSVFINLIIFWFIYFRF